MGNNQGISGTAVSGVIGEDVHVVGIRIVEHALRKAGLKIVPLGAQVSQDEFVDAAVETKADAILVSSLSGHADVLVPGLREKCDDAGLKGIRMYLGGHLGISNTPWSDVERKFRDLGFDRVYPPSVQMSQVIQDLQADLEK